jgi:integrase
MSINTYTHQHHRDYKSTLLKLPPNINKSPQYRNKSIDEILAMKGKPAASHTINKNLVSISSFFEWAIRYGFTNQNPAKLMTIKSPKRANEERKEFSDADLEKLFKTPIFIEKSFKKPYQYWLPILALLTGARLNELCQLHLSDFEKIEGINLIRIVDDGGGKKVKSRAANRDIPIHPQLIRLGLLDYVAFLKSKGELRLFPELKLSRDGYGQVPSKWFARYRKSCGIIDSGKVFHSFRHTFINKLKQSNVGKEKIAQLVGHEDESETFGRYGKIYDATVMDEVINLLNFNLSSLK